MGCRLVWEVWFMFSHFVPRSSASKSFQGTLVGNRPEQGSRTAPAPQPPRPGSAAAGLRRHPVLFGLPPVPDGRRLLLMGSGKPVGASTGPESHRLSLPPSPRALLKSVPGGCSDDTLHRRTTALGEAAQFNRSVSAMPEHDSPHFPAPVSMGTAVTLLLR